MNPHPVWQAPDDFAGAVLRYGGLSSTSKARRRSTAGTATELDIKGAQ